MRPLSDYPPETDGDEDYVSKSQLKREAQAVTELAQTLVEAKP